MNAEIVADESLLTLLHTVDIDQCQDEHRVGTISELRDTCIVNVVRLRYAPMLMLGTFWQ